MNRAFTLIELLIVVAIISILAAIALPNFQEAQTRAKVAGVKSNMRTVATMLEVYGVDYNKYPAGFTRFVPPNIPDGAIGWPAYPSTDAIIIGGIVQLSPIGRSNYKMDLFLREDDANARNPTGALVYYNLRFMTEIIDQGAAWSNQNECNWKLAHQLGGAWALHSVGPAGIPYYVSSFNWGGVGMSGNGTALVDGGETQAECTDDEKRLFHEYDPTNGTVSLGYIYRTQANPTGLGTNRYFYENLDCPFEL